MRLTKMLWDKIIWDKINLVDQLVEGNIYVLKHLLHAEIKIETHKIGKLQISLRWDLFRFYPMIDPFFKRTDLRRLPPPSPPGG